MEVGTQTDVSVIDALLFDGVQCWSAVVDKAESLRQSMETLELREVASAQFADEETQRGVPCRDGRKGVQSSTS